MSAMGGIITLSGTGFPRNGYVRSNTLRYCAILSQTVTEIKCRYLTWREPNSVLSIFSASN